MTKGEQILVIARAIQAVFTSSEWTEVGYLTGTDEYISNHPRLLRSLGWGDADYKGHALDAVKRILEADGANLAKLVRYEAISDWLRVNDPGALQALEADAFGMIVAPVLPEGQRAAIAALADAQALLESRGPTSAVDRVHTGLHGFLKGVATEASLAFDADATPNQLLKLVVDRHPALRDLGPREQEVRRLLRTAASIIDSMGTLRNRASLAHPNDELLDNEEAMFVINLARSLIRFLDAKLRGAV